MTFTITFHHKLIVKDRKVTCNIFLFIQKPVSLGAPSGIPQPGGMQQPSGPPSLSGPPGSMSHPPQMTGPPGSTVRPPSGPPSLTNSSNMGGPPPPMKAPGGQSHGIPSRPPGSGPVLSGPPMTNGSVPSSQNQVSIFSFKNLYTFRTTEEIFVFVASL